MKIEHFQGQPASGYFFRNSRTIGTVQKLRHNLSDLRGGWNQFVSKRSSSATIISELLIRTRDFEVWRIFV